MIVLGLTGSIGMGKSEAARALRRLGLPVFDSDQQVHVLLAAGGAIAEAVEKAFPGVARDGVVDRAALGARVFGHTTALKELEAILHPAVGAARSEFLAECRARGDRLAVLDVPLLFETGGEAACDHVMVVSAPAEIQRQRVMARDGMSEERFRAILAGQMPDAEKRRRADFIISTDRPMEDTFEEIRAMVEKLRQKN
ncbi:MAG: dephospho-CoA kinase [Proteobacteria bacterium]|nr:dephospho-CoA kinase [Pseudomonadota bacterium]